MILQKSVDKLFAKLNDVKWEEKQIFRKGQKIYLQAQSEPRPALPGIFRSVGRPQTNRLPTTSLRNSLILSPIIVRQFHAVIISAKKKKTIAVLTIIIIVVALTKD